MILYVTKNCPYCTDLVKELKGVMKEINVITIDKNNHHNIPAFPALYDEDNNVLVVGYKIIDYISKDNGEITPFHKAYLKVVTNSVRECTESEIHLSK